MRDVRSLWVVVWHPKGALHVLQLGDLVERNVAAIRRGEESWYVPMGLGLTMDEALEKRLEIRREFAGRGELNRQGAEDAKGEG